MSLIHNLSGQSIDSGLNMFQVPHTNTSLESGRHVASFPLAAIDDYAPIEFRVAGDGDEYLDLSHTYLFLQAKITNVDGINSCRKQQSPANSELVFQSF